MGGRYNGYWCWSAFLLGVCGQLLWAIPDQWLHRWSIPLQGTWELSTDGGSTWHATTIPHTVFQQTELRYRRSIRMDSTALRWVWHLSTRGLGDVAEVYLNGRYAGQLVSYGLPNIVTLPASLWRVGENTVELRLSAGLLPPSFLGPRRVLGCFRELFLVGTSSAWLAVAEVFTTLSLDRQSGQLHLKLGIGGKSPDPLTLRFQLKRLRDSAMVLERTFAAPQVPPRLQTTIELTSPELWSPETPTLYEARIELLQGTQPIDGAIIRTGFRSVGTTTTESAAVVTCNAARLPMYGVEYYPPLSPASMTSLQATVRQWKALGITTVRLRDYPSPDLLQALAVAGITAVCDLPIAELPPQLLSSPRVRSSLQHYLRLFLPQLSNPAIVAVTLWQGLPQHPAVRAYEDEMLRWLQPYNLLLAVESYANTRFESSPRLPLLFLRVHPPFADLASLSSSLTSWRNYARRYALVPIGGMPISPNEEHRGYLVPNSEEAQARWIWSFLSACASSGTAGAIVWSWQDYATSFPLISFPFPAAHVCSTGIADGTGTPRVAYSALQAFLQQDLEPLLVPGTPPADLPPLHTLLAALLLLGMGWMLNRVPRFRQHVWRALARSISFFADLRDGRFVDYVATLVWGAFCSFAAALFASLIQEWLRVQPPLVILLWHLLPSPAIREAVAWSITRPWAQLLVNAFLFAGIFATASTFIALVARLLRRNVSWMTSLSVIVWASLPVLLPTPLLLAGVRLMSSPEARIVTFLLLGAVGIWSCWRILRGAQSILRLRLWSFLVGTSWIAVTAGVRLLGIYETSRSLSTYVSY
ncbi:MAG: hypothetical protein ABDH31_06425, partial [Chlorobiota bacterium]